MKIAIFDTHYFERQYFDKINKDYFHHLTFFEPRLTSATAVLASKFPAVCSFANDKVDAETLSLLKSGGVKLIALRSAGFNHVDLDAARRLQIKVVRVPHYSPYSVAEHTVALLLALNRKIHRAHARVRELNFSLDGLVGFDLHGKTVGIIGTGKIGSVVARIMNGFGCNILAHDSSPNHDLERDFRLQYVDLTKLYSESDIISFHLPLTRETRHLVNEASFSKMKPGVFLINTGRGALIDSQALIQNLKTGQVGAAGLDVYEEEENIFFRNLSNEVLQDDTLARLLTFSNVLITSHQGFLTKEALHNIVKTTLQNLSDFENGRELINEVK